ncbi:integrase, catalytic region, zinc finger, CCHC-type containing protein [Tanacetum coccineum]
MMVTRLLWWCGDDDDDVMMRVAAAAETGGGGGERRVEESGCGDRIDPVMRSVFGIGRKSPPEKFSGGGGVVVAGIRRHDSGDGGVDEGGATVGERNIKVVVWSGWWPGISLVISGGGGRQKIYRRRGLAYQSQTILSNQPLTPLSITYPSNDYQLLVHHNAYSSPSSIPQIKCAPTVNQQQQQPEFHSLDLGLTVPVFKQGDDPIDAINHVMSFLSAVVTSRYPTTNNQLGIRQTLGNKLPLMMEELLYNQFRGDKMLLLRNDSWFKDKVVVVQAQANGQILHEEELAFLEDPDLQKGSDSNIIPYSHVNDTLTAELERYKEQVKLLKEGQNVDLKSKDNVLYSSAQSIEIDHLKQTLSEHLKEKESLMKTSKMSPHMGRLWSKTTLESKTFEVKMNQVLNENERLLEQVINKDIVNIILNSSVGNTSMNVHECEKCLKLKTELLNKSDFVEKEIYDKLFKSFTTLEKHCISLEVNNQLNQEVFKRDNSISNQSALSFDQYFELNELKAQAKRKGLGIKLSTGASRSQPSGNTKKDKIQQTPKKVSKRNCLETKKPTGKVFTNTRYTWRPTGRIFTIVGNACPLTRITTTSEVPRRKPTALESDTPKPVVVQIILWYLDSSCSKHMTEDRSQLTNFVNKYLGTVKFGNDHVAKILGYGDYQIGNVMISKVYYVEGLGHNLFSFGQFCDSNLEVAFRQHTCFIRNLEAPVRQIKTNNGTEFVNQTLREYYEKVDISHETSVARSPQQNGVIERRNRTLIEATRTMLIYAKALLFLWAEEVATACYTQNRSIICLCHGKTPYELLHDKLHDLSFFHVSGALCYPTNDSENLGKLQPKADIGLMPNPPPSTPFVPPSRNDWDILFQPLFDELLNPPSSFDRPASKVIAPITEVVAPEPAASTGPPSSTTVDQDASSPSNSQTTPKTQSLVISNDVEEENHNLDVSHMNNDPFFGLSIPKNDSEASSSSDVIPTIVQTAAPNSEHITK